MHVEQAQEDAQIQILIIVVLHLIQEKVLVEDVTLRNGQNHPNISIDTTRCLRTNARMHIVGNLMTYRVLTNALMGTMRWYFAHD